MLFPHVAALVIDPQSPATLYAGTSAGLFGSTEGGASWVASNVGMAVTYVRAIAVDPQNSGTLYAGVSAPSFGGVFKTTGGANWSNAPLPAGNGVNLLVIDPQEPANLYAENSTGFYKSADPAGTWNSITPGTCCRVVVDPQTTGTAYVSGNGVFKTTDGGASWSGINHDLANVVLLLLDPKESSTIYAAGYVGIFKSTDAGANWNAVNTGLPADSLGRYLGVASLLVDPQNPATLYAATVAGVFRTTDGAATWTAVNSGLTSIVVNTLAMDPQDSKTLYAGTAGGGVFVITFIGA